MQIYQEKKIAGFQIEGKRIQLLQITTEEPPIINGTVCLGGITKWQVRMNRKIILTTFSKDQAQRKMASLITGELLQTKFTF